MIRFYNGKTLRFDGGAHLTSDEVWTEGAHWKNVFGTYSHGPMLPKNPAFCDVLLATALERKYGRTELEPLEDVAETAAHDEMCAKL